MQRIFESLLEDVTSSFGNYLEEDKDVVYSTPSLDKSILDSIEISSNYLRVALYKHGSIEEGVEIRFRETPYYDEKKRRYVGGNFYLLGYAKKGDMSKSYIASHQCHVGGSSGYDGALFTLSNIFNILNDKNLALFQVMPHVLKAIKRAENHLSISNTYLSDTYYLLYLDDLQQTVNYIVGIESESNVSQLEKWSAWYGLGGTLVNLLNLELSRKELSDVKELLLSSPVLMDYLNKVINEDSFVLNGFDTMYHRVKSILYDMALKYSSESKYIKELVDRFKLSKDRLYFTYDKRKNDINLEAIIITSKSRLNELIRYLYNFSELKLLSIFGVNIFNIPKEISLLDISHLRINCGFLREIPNFIYSMHQLEELDLEDNYISYIDDSISLLDNLKHLTLSHNLISKLPRGLFDLKLSSLNMRRNLLRKIGSEIGEMSELEYLNLSINQIRKIPRELFNIDLKYLILDGNFLRSIPNDINKLVHLKHLSIRNNARNIKLPKTLYNLTQLEKFNIQGSPIKNLNYELFKRFYLKVLKNQSHQL